MEIKKEPLPTWLFFMIVLLAFIAGAWISIVYANMQCQEMYAEAIKNLSMANIHPDSALRDVLINISG